MELRVINLETSRDRLARVSAALDRAGLGFARFTAVDARGWTEISAEIYDRAHARRYFGRGLTGGEIGCYISHVRVLEEFLRGPAGYCLVFEDDAVVPATLAADLAALEEVLGAAGDWSVINLGNRARKFRSAICPVAGQSGANTLYRAHYFPMNTTCLLWSRGGAAAFLKAALPIFAPIDHRLRDWCLDGDTGLALERPLVAVEEGPSEIDASGGARREAKTTGAILYLLSRQWRLRRNNLRAKRAMRAYQGWG